MQFVVFDVQKRCVADCGREFEHFIRFFLVVAAKSQGNK
jgi:hypothetical protein